MGKLKGFIEYERAEEGDIPVRKRLKNFKEFTIKPSESKLQKQGGRCMDCGVPFCHSGCPLGNLIPDFNCFSFASKVIFFKFSLDSFTVEPSGAISLS